MHPAPAQTSYWSKLAVTLFAAIAIVSSYFFIPFFRFPPPRTASLLTTIYQHIPLVLTVAGSCFAIIFPVFWHRREQKEGVDGAKIRAWFIAVIRYWLALAISAYGFGKIFQTQFGPSYVRNDSLVGQLSGFALTWNYFGYSYALSCIIAALQISGSILLLFRRTTLLGVIMLLPVMTNIVLIDLFYGIPAGATRNAILFTAALVYLLSLYWPAIKPVLLRPLEHTVKYSGWIKYAARVLVIASSCGSIAYMAFFRMAAPKMAGKWTVTETVRNNQPSTPLRWLTDSTEWKNIYFEPYRQITCSPNPYVVERKRAQNGEYTLLNGGNSLAITLTGREKPIMVNIARSGNDHMEWRYHDGNDTIRLKLARAPL